VSESEGQVTIFRGVNADLPGLDLSRPYETTDIALADLSDYDQGQVREGIGFGDLAAARRTVDNLSAEQVARDEPSGTSTAVPSPDRSTGS
jgi:protein phosphatase